MPLPVLLMLAGCCAAAMGQYAPSTTPVPILKQINRHNEDGSYSYGYEAADGSYKIESKYPSGEVYGKYGFVDDTGAVREVEYGASRRGFEPAGTGINVPPPTVHGNSIAGGRASEPDDDGQYREDPSVYYTDPRYTNGERYEPVPNRYPIQNHQQLRPLTYSAPSKPAASVYRRPDPPAQAAPLLRYQQSQYQQPQYQQEYQPQYRTQYQRQYESSAAPGAPYRRPQYSPSQYSGLGSYSVNYKR